MKRTKILRRRNAIHDVRKYLPQTATLVSRELQRRRAARFFCEEVGFVSRVHLLSGEVRSVTTALKVVEEVQEGLQEIEDQ